MSKTGEWYIVIVTIIAQVVASITRLIGAIFEQLNTGYTPETSALLPPTIRGNTFSLRSVFKTSVRPASVS